MRDRYSSRIRGWPVRGKAWLLPGKRTNSTVLPSRFSATKYSSLWATGQRASASPWSSSAGAVTFLAWVMGERASSFSGASIIEPPHWASPKLTPMSEVPYMVYRLVQGAPMTAAPNRPVWPMTQPVM